VQKRKVIIVGGGLAGLSAAYELSSSGDFDIHLIEKDKQLGGRVQSCTINGQVVDIGGFLIYPWYERYKELVEALGLSDELVKVPEAADYYVAKPNTHEEYHKGFNLSFKELIDIFIRVFPNEIIDRDPTRPLLNAYDHLSIADYLMSLHLKPERVNFYLTVFDTYLQGYCYGPVTQHKMSFMAATLFQNILHGDVHSASYLRNGSKVFIDAMHDELKKRGVHFHLQCRLESISGQQIQTSSGVMTADDFIFCQRPDAVAYSRFITATVSYSGSAHVGNDADWGSCFYKEDEKHAYPILSIVNLEKLYGAKAAGHLNLNIKVSEADQTAITDTDLLAGIRSQMQIHFPDIAVQSIVNRIDWEKAMPIATEDYVASKRMAQGLQDIYYAGDFMGCPSMETALMNGKRAAQQLL
jgi:hypothetical protein